MTAATPPSDAHASPLARFDGLFRDHQRAVLAYAIRRTPTLADAEDAAAETFIVAWRKIGTAPASDARPSQPAPWPGASWPTSAVAPDGANDSRPSCASRTSRPWSLMWSRMGE
ncbi:MAG: sigma factor [Candidatus Limnocylindrales bacterium]